MTLPTDPKARKAIPVWSGCIAYFPDALVAVAMLSQAANEQHNPGEPLHWAKEKSTDEEDAGMRHAIEPLLIGGSPYDSDGFAHKVKKAWRALADLQRFLEAGNVARAFTPGPGGLRIPCVGADGGFSTAVLSELPRCTECNRPNPNHAPNCSKNFRHLRQPFAAAVEELTLYQTPGHGGEKPAGDPAPGLDSELRPVAPAIHCPQCGSEGPGHFAGCLSRAANGGV